MAHTKLEKHKKTRTILVRSLKISMTLSKSIKELIYLKHTWRSKTNS